MPETIYCWRCQMDIPMLDEDEWSRIKALLTNRIEAIKRYREETGASLKDALRDCREQPVLEEYRCITGFQETNVNALWHHRLSLYGSPCVDCGRRLRTPASSGCVDCPNDD